MLDLAIRNATLVDGRQGIDIGIQGDRIVAVSPALADAAAAEIDAAGRQRDNLRQITFRDGRAPRYGRD